MSTTGEKIRTQRGKLSPDNNEAQPLAEPEAFSEIKLEESEIADALLEGRKKKYFKLKHEAYWAEVEKEITYEKYTAEELFDLFTKSDTYNGKKFQLTQDGSSDTYIRIVKNLCCYFTGDPRFSGDLAKGLALLSDPGTGKTALMKFFAVNQKQSFRVVSMIDVADDYKQNGEGAVRFYNINATGSTNKFGSKLYGYCFDDVGTEEVPCKWMGNSKNLFAEIFLARHSHVPIGTTHITSNNDPLKSENGLPSLSELYGSRVLDRMKETFNIISFDGVKSWR
jgi:hypothetical protein